MITQPDFDMQNGPGSKASEFHEATKHSEVSVRTSGHYLDWDNKPSPFKVYTGVPLQDLPTDFLRPALNALVSISGVPKEKDSTAMGVDTLAELLFFSAGITREVKVQGRGTFYFRAAPATGALYPIELYVVCKNLEGLEAGVYHFSPGDFSLSLLRSGDWTQDAVLLCWITRRHLRSSRIHSPHVDRVEEFLEVSGALVQALVLGRRGHRGKPPRDGQLGRASLVGGPRFRGRSRQQAPRPEGEAGGGDRDMPGGDVRRRVPARSVGGRSPDDKIPAPDRPRLPPALQERGGIPARCGKRTRPPVCVISAR